MSMNFKKKNVNGRQNSSPHNDSQSFEDDEYIKVIEGIKKVYKHKIKPLEVTYNFEGKK